MFSLIKFAMVMVSIHSNRNPKTKGFFINAGEEVTTIRKNISRVKQNSSVGKGIATKLDKLDFNPQDPHGGVKATGRKTLTPLKGQESRPEVVAGL